MNIFERTSKVIETDIPGLLNRELKLFQFAKYLLANKANMNINQLEVNPASNHYGLESYYVRGDLGFIRVTVPPLFEIEAIPSPKIITHEIDGKKIAVTDMTEYLIQVGKGSKGSYRTRFKVTGNLSQAIMLYKGINIGNGYKKRLLAPSLNKPLLAKHTS